MRHITQNGVIFFACATEGMKITSSNFDFEASGKGYVTIMVPDRDRVKVVKLDSSTGITRVKIHENTLTISRGKHEETHEIVVGSNSSYQLLPKFTC